MVKKIKWASGKMSFIAAALFLFTIRPGLGQNKNPDGLLSKRLWARGAKPVLIDSGFIFTEGPAADREGNIFFADQPNDKIWKYDIHGKLSVFLNRGGRSNGMYFDAKGNLISCADEHNQLWSINPKGGITVLVKDYHGHVLNGPNDLWIAPSGDIYLTDPYYQRDYWTRTGPDPALGGKGLYYLPRAEKDLVLLDSGMVQPNGIVGSADGKYLYVADLGAGKTYRYEINPDGTLKNKRIFINEGSDGMTTDDRGNIYITGDGVTVYDRNGRKIGHLDIPEKWTANVCFGGRHRSLLFITASKSIYTIQTLVKGVE